MSELSDYRAFVRETARKWVGYFNGEKRTTLDLHSTAFEAERLLKKHGRKP